MARKKTRNLAKTAAAIAATALVGQAIKKAAEDPRVRRKAKAVGKALKKRAQSTGRKIAKAIRNRGKAKPRRTARTRKVSAR
jgi:hypothetical protein